jgi:hypothetical protein
MSEYLTAYALPSNMTGMKVLDVGRASGFFSFEFERRGADVTATEIRSYFDWDFVGGTKVRDKRRIETKDPEEFTKRQITGAFFHAHCVKDSKVKPVFANVYDLSPCPYQKPHSVQKSDGLRMRYRVGMPPSNPISARVFSLHPLELAPRLCRQGMIGVALDEQLQSVRAAAREREFVFFAHCDLGIARSR